MAACPISVGLDQRGLCDIRRRDGREFGSVEPLVDEGLIARRSQNIYSRRNEAGTAVGQGSTRHDRPRTRELAQTLTQKTDVRTRERRYMIDD